ncbi:MAG TPA: 4Fe-4S binding protein [Smithellaceae bacterium]|nr:4Fe-4S binding protein [Smithellaceae bacterium]HQM44843.1 4Fe-4S binding protein [Smithellaceae bacterium]
MEKILRKIIEIDEELCNGCGQCVTGCAEGALQIVGEKAKVVSETFCDGLGACIGECPTGALKIVEREAQPFDEEAVKQHLADHKSETLPCGCPSTHIQIFHQPPVRQTDGKTKPMDQEPEESFLTHWPIQIKLIPAGAPFLKGADLLVLADCTAVAFPSLHSNLLRGKVVMMGCPKFDDVQEYVLKFADIFKNADIRSVTTAVMEVPCCSGMPVIVKKGMEASKKNIPLKEIVLSLKGKILKQ